MVTVLVGLLGLIVGACAGAGVALTAVHDIVRKADKRVDEALAALRLHTATCPSQKKTGER